MGFFDDVSKQVTNYGQKAVQKTKDVSETVRINTQISDEERRITSCFTQMGKLYYSLYKDSCGAEFAELVNVVEASELKIKSYKKQLQDIKGVDICPKCGAEMPKNALFCSSCGSSVAKAAPVVNAADYVSCSACGAAVKKGARFCTSCGAPMAAVQEKPEPVVEPAVEPAVEAAVEPVVEPAVEAVVEPAGGNVCPNCGAQLESDSLFCTECGTKIGG